MRVLSLFDGMSCGQLALQRANKIYTAYYASEIDKYAIHVAQKNYPNTIQVGDVACIDFSKYDVDLLIGGSPCQGFSSAGKLLGFADERSNLFFKFKEALDTINPRYFLLENVNMRKADRDVISSALGVEPIRINSSLFSAQLRDRLYWTNIPVNMNIPDKGILLKDIITSGIVDRDKSYAIDANYFRGSNIKSYRRGRRQIVFTDTSYTHFRILTPEECEVLQTVPIGYTNHVSKSQRYKMLGNGWTIDVISYILQGVEV